MVRKNVWAVIMTVVIACGVMPQPAVYADGEWWKQAVLYIVGGAVVNELTGTKSEQKKGWNSTVSANQQRNLQVFVSLPESTRKHLFEANEGGYFKTQYGQKKDVMWDIHLDLVEDAKKAEEQRAQQVAAFQAAQLEALRLQRTPQQATQPTTVPIRTQEQQSGRIIERPTADGNVRLYGHLRGQDKWEFLPADESNFARYDWMNVKLREIPGKVTIVGDIDGQRIEGIWCSDWKLADAAANRWVQKPVQERDAEIRNQDGWLLFRPLAFEVPENAKRMSLQVNIWKSDIFTPKPDEQTSFVQAVHENDREDEVQGLSALPESFWEQTGQSSDLKLAMAPAK